MPDAPPRPEPFTARDRPRSAGRPPRAAARDPLAGRPRGRRVVARYRPRLPARARRLLGRRVRLARAGGGAGPLPRFRVPLGGLGIHFVHARAVAPAGPVLPLVLSHGWPDSFWRYSKVIPLLTDPGAHGADPADAFDVVVPDMPGYGYSDRPTGPPLNSIDVAGLWAELMGVLGYARFGAAGGDMGSHVSRYLALDHPDRVVAVHRTDAGLPVFTGDPADAHARGTCLVRPGAAAWGATEGAYAAMHRTKPQTAAFGLTDSPAGLAAWIVEKLRGWSDCDGDVERSFTKDEILTNVTLYWLTGTIGSSMRMYRANAAIPPAQLARRVEVPSGFSLFRGDVVRPPRAWLERTANVGAGHRARPRRALRAVRGARALRRGTARVLPALPGGGDGLRRRHADGRGTRSGKETPRTNSPDTRQRTWRRQIEGLTPRARLNATLKANGSS